MTPEAAPRTAAGRLFVALLAGAEVYWPDEYTRLSVSLFEQQVSLIEAEAAAGTALDRPVITSAELEAMTVAERTAYVHDRAVIAAAKLPQAVLNSIKAPAALDVERLARALHAAYYEHRAEDEPLSEWEQDLDNAVEWYRSPNEMAAAIAAAYAQEGEGEKPASGGLPPTPAGSGRV